MNSLVSNPDQPRLNSLLSRQSQPSQQRQDPSQLLKQGMAMTPEQRQADIDRIMNGLSDADKQRAAAEIQRISSLLKRI